MEPILTIDNLNSFGGNMLRQGDKSQLKYRLRDVGNKNLSISGKSCQITMYGRNYTTVVYETSTTVSSDNTVSFTINKVLPKGTFYLEFTVGDYIFPTDHKEFFEITPSGKGMDANVIEIVGKDVIIREVKSQVDAELQPLVTSLESAEQAEAQRVSAESSRVSAEAQRVIDHANRSAELAGKADKVVIKNEFANGDFSQGMTGWILWGNAGVDTPFYSLVGNNLVIDGNSTSNGRIAQDINCNAHDKLYVNIPMSGTGNIIVNKSDYGSWNNLQTISYAMNNSFSTIIGDREVDNVRLGIGYISGAMYNNKTIYSMQVINLTQTFGAGNEPTKEEMDRLIEITGYIDGEYALNNKEMLGHLMKGIGEKANKKQEDWLTPTLLNGASGNIQFRKNQFGRVEFRGKITGQQGGRLFLLPLGYRPINVFRTLAQTTVGTNDARTVLFQTAGSVHFEQPYGTFEVYFDTISFIAE